MMGRILTFVLITALLSACMPDKNEYTFQTDYFKLTPVLDSQIVYLQKKGVDKTIEINGKKENISQNEVDWKKELEPFYDAEINKPVYASLYEQSERNTENGKLVTYKFKGAVENGVKEMVIAYDSKNQLSSITADIQDLNFIYENRKTIQMSFSENILTAYTIDGSQKVIFKDPFSYLVEGKVKI
jgi:hypothetical protein